MTIHSALYASLMLHLLGDYILQNDWMATKKTTGALPALIHAAIYSAPFALLVPSVWWAPIFTTHYLIDRYRLAVLWIRLVNWNWNSTNFGFDENKPKYMSVWLMIIVDNFFHIVINTACICAHYTL